MSAFDEAAPQWHPAAHKTLTETVKKCFSRDAANSFAHHPRVQFDDMPAKRTIEAQWI
jgi:hypothetical protein